MDELYEEFLMHNRIDPSTVTLNRAHEILKRNQTVENGRKVKPDKNLLRTGYTILPRLHYKSERPFYYDAQSCVSFVYHMIEWTKKPLSKKITFEFFGRLFKILDSIFSSPPLKREVIG
jgi:hypothetical protein